MQKSRHTHHNQTEMSACKLGTTPVNRLTQEQCDRMILRWFYKCHADEWLGIFVDTNHYLAVKNRIQQYKDNLKHRNLK